MKKILILCTIVGLFSFDTYKNTSELERLIFESDPPQIEKALALVSQMQEEKDIREIAGIEKILKRVTVKYREDTKILRTHYVSKYGQIKVQLEDLLLMLQITKTDIGDSCDEYDFIYTLAKKRIERGDYARGAEVRYLKNNVDSYTAYILESLKVEKNRTLLHFLVETLSKSKDPMLDTSLINILEDNNLSFSPQVRNKLFGALILTKTAKAQKYLLNAKEETKDPWLLRNLEYLINVHINGKSRFYIYEEKEKSKPKKNTVNNKKLVKEEKEKEKVDLSNRPGVIRPEDKGEDFTKLTTETIVCRFMDLNFAETFKQKHSHFNEDYIWLRKFTRELGNRNLRGDYQPTNEEKVKIQELVNYYIDLYYSDSMQGAEEAAIQVLRLWNLAIPTLFFHLESEDDKKRSFAVNFLIKMRDEEVTDFILERALVAETPKLKAQYVTMLRVMKNASYRLLKDRPYLSEEEAKRIYQEKIAPVREKLR